MGVWSTVKSKVKSMINTSINALKKAAKTVYGWLADALGWILDKAGWIYDKIAGWVAPITDKLMEWGGKLYSRIMGWVSPITDGMKDYYDKAVNALKGRVGTVEDAVEYIKGQIAFHTKDLTDKINEIGDEFKSWVNDKLGDMWDTIDYKLQVAKNYASEALDKALGGVMDMIGEVYDFAYDMMVDMVEYVDKKLAKVGISLDKIIDKLSDVTEIIFSPIKLIDWIGDALGEVW